jgi:hypothetical protein
MDRDKFPGISEPEPSITWSIEASWSDPDPLMKTTHTIFNESMLAVFMKTIPGTSSLIVLDWHHTSYRFYPHEHTGSCLPTGHAKGELTSWMTPVLPYGDYYIFLSDDFSFGTFGHPWEGTICVWGDQLLRVMGDLPLDGARIIRRNGAAV